MISMMELMEEKTPLTKNTDKKKGMTLVEVMAAMAILSILFVGISGLMINTAKIEERSDKLLEASSYLKSALLLFDAEDSTGDIVDISKYIGGKKIYFTTIDNMQQKIISADDSAKKAEDIYELSIIATEKERVDNKYIIYEVTANMNGTSKSIYVTRI